MLKMVYSTCSDIMKTDSAATQFLEFSPNELIMYDSLSGVWVQKRNNVIYEIIQQP